MISTKKFAQMAKKWERMADLRRKRLNLVAADNECCTSVAPEGHCIIYSADGRRFKVTLAYLGTTIFAELLRMSQEEFGFGSDGRITLPCDAAETKYVMCLLRRNASEEVERAFLSSVVSSCHQGNGLAPPMELSQQVAACSF
ncbi:auxin-responsive protein SAUR36-like [Lolium rigidum]|uniref:auxin-responsive protein SAUR36-like n=1 Tax=Lolium rigidum TaxID=89674 RepID=UPI001F5DE76C|nr:auxin-responsive protein SAUR36-like [Lolium rigidum]